jgi:hypothetical protein
MNSLPNFKVKYQVALFKINKEKYLLTCFLMQIESLFYLYVIQLCNDFIFKLTSEIRVFGVAKLTDDIAQTNRKNH